MVISPLKAIPLPVNCLQNLTQKSMVKDVTVRNSRTIPERLQAGKNERI